MLQTHGYHELISKEVEIVKKRLAAFCNSIYCGANRRGTANGLGIRKHVSERTSFCPDCSSALFWMTEQRQNARFKKYYKK